MSVVRATRRLVVVTDGDDDDLDGGLGHEDVGHEDVGHEDVDGGLDGDRRERVGILVIHTFSVVVGLAFAEFPNLLDAPFMLGSNTPQLWTQLRRTDVYVRLRFAVLNPSARTVLRPRPLASLQNDRRESVDILADDLRSAINGAKTLLCVR